MWAFSWFVSIVILGINFYFVGETLVSSVHTRSNVRNSDVKMNQSQNTASLCQA
jgi:hypothetical protein